jgi:uncharacterized protein
MSIPLPLNPPPPAYSTPPINEPFYTQLASTTSRTLVHSYTVPPRSGYAWHVPAKSILRLTTPEGPQVGDLNLWNAHNPRERFWAARTRQLQKAHVSTGDRLWSCIPYIRPMVTIVKDTLDGVERCHDLLGTRCDPYGTATSSSTSLRLLESEKTRSEQAPNE